MKYRLGMCWLVMVALLLPTKVFAEDIDLFVGRSTSDKDIPNVLVVLDNTGNWGPEQDFLEQKAALRRAFEIIKTDYLGKLKLGLLLYTEEGSKSDGVNSNSGPKGAYVRSAIRLMDEEGIDALSKLIVGDPNDPDSTGLDFNDDRGSAAIAGLAMAEAYLYFFGGSDTWEVPYAGNNKVKADFAGNTSNSSPDSLDSWKLPGNALNSFGATKYNSPVDPDACAGNYIIYIGNGPARDQLPDFEVSQEILKNMRGVSDIWERRLPQYKDKNGKEDVAFFDVLADEWAYYMLNDSPLEIQTYAIDVQIVNQANQCTQSSSLAWGSILDNMATDLPQKKTYFRQCGTEFKSADFEADFLAAIGGILSRNSVFASVALPAAANEQSTFLNNVYIGQFRPDPDASPRWFGNLKQYKIGIVEDPVTKEETLQVVDADNAALVETNPLADNAGFVKGCGRSFWTPESETKFTGPTGDLEHYWDYLSRIDTATQNDPVQNCLADEAGSNTKDGQIVEKGGQAYMLRKNATRSAWTCNPTVATCNTAGLKAFADGNIPAGALDGNDPTDRAELISWAIGYDVDDEDQDSNTSEMRPTVHGDIVHSQPVAKDYAGDPNNPEIVVFYGGNDGMLRAINGNQTTDHGSKDAGDEFWAFMPSEFYGEIKRLRVNDETIKFPASGPTAGQGVSGTKPKGYGMDGPLSLYDFNNDLDADVEFNLYAGMRRAGRTIYSFDVSDRTTPKLNWKIGCPVLDPNDPTASVDPNDPLGCTEDMQDIGQTWSRVAVTYAAGYDPYPLATDGDGELDPLILVGGGYDPCEDYDDGVNANNNCSSTKGNRIYLLDALTGAEIHTFKTRRSVPGNITVVPVSDDDPRILFAYAVDTGGNVYRISGGSLGDGPGDNNYAPEIIDDTDPADWIITRIASLGCDSADDSCTANRKFLFGPDVIRLEDGLFGILVGSGDREKPLLDYSATVDVTNYFYSLVDAPESAVWLDGECSANIICQDSLTTLDRDDLVDGIVPTPKGWRLELRSGEQVVTGAITADNDIYFSTHIPTQPDACDADYGTATAYSLNYFDASGTDTEFLGGGLVPTPVAGKVIIDGVPVPFCIGCGAEGSPIGVGKIGGGIDWTQPRSRVYWNIDRVE